MSLLTPGCSAQERRKVRRIEEMFPKMHTVIPEGDSGDVTIRYFEVSPDRASLNRLTRNELWTPGMHVQLDIGATGWMFDSLHEKCMNEVAVRRATGDVLIAGLGIGMILWPILAKDCVRSVTVLENSEDVVRLVLPSLQPAKGGEKLKIVMADAGTWPETQDPAQFDWIWLDCVPAYGYSIQVMTVQEEWMNLFRPLARKPLAVGHWGFEENVEYHLAQSYGIKPRKPYPVGPGITVAHVLMSDKLDALGFMRPVEEDREKLMAVALPRPGGTNG